MPIYRIELTPAALRQLEALPKKIQVRIAGRIDKLKSDPRPSGCVKLRDSDDIYRIRVGDYRILYKIRDNALLIIVVKVGKRGQIYKR